MVQCGFNDNSTLRIAVTIMQDGCVTSNARVFVLVGTYKRRKYIWNMLLTIGYSEEQLVNV